MDHSFCADCFRVALRWAIPIASDDFAYADGSLNAQNGGTGWSGGWSGPGYGVQGNKAVALDAPGTASRLLSSPVHFGLDGTLYLSWTFRNSESPVSGLLSLLSPTDDPLVRVRFGLDTPFSPDSTFRPTGVAVGADDDFTAGQSTQLGQSYSSILRVQTYVG